MKHILILSIAVLFTLCGCEKPAPVEVALDLEDAIEVIPAAVADTAYETSAVDSTGILPAEHLRFAGLLVVNNVKFDTGDGIISRSYSRVLFENRSRPVTGPNGRIRGYFGMYLGSSLSLNGAPMLPVFHRVPVRRPLADTAVIAGIEYVVDLTTSYSSNTTYTWSATADTIGAVGVSIQSPDDLTVQSPMSGTELFRNRDLQLRWTGRGNISIIVSTWNPLTKKTTPILHMRPRVNRGHSLISAKLLALLPANRYYMFTFVLANRKESMVVSRFSGEILVQAASVYNTFVVLH